jgi:hypothetical protein
MINQTSAIEAFTENVTAGDVWYFFELNHGRTWPDIEHELAEDIPPEDLDIIKRIAIGYHRSKENSSCSDLLSLCESFFSAQPFLVGLLQCYAHVETVAGIKVGGFPISPMRCTELARIAAEWQPCDSCEPCWENELERECFEKCLIEERSRKLEESNKAMAPLAAKHRERIEKTREIQKRGVDAKRHHTEKLHAFIRKQYERLRPQIEAENVQVKEAYDKIQNAVSISFKDPKRPGNPLEVSFSLIDRALGKKK